MSLRPLISPLRPDDKSRPREGVGEFEPARARRDNLVYAEAMAAGKPVIGCRTQGAEDLIRSEEEGLLVEPRSVPSLASALERLLLDESWARSLGEAGVRRARRFGWERNARSYQELYQRLLATEGQSPASS